MGRHNSNVQIFAHNELLDVLEDIAEGVQVDVNRRIIEAARDYQRICGFGTRNGSASFNVIYRCLINEFTRAGLLTKGTP